MLEIKWEWLATLGLLLFLFGYVAYQRRCQVREDEDSDDE